MNSEEAFLEYELYDGRRVMLAFDHINDLDGCHISLDMYRANLGAVTDDVLKRILEKFHGRILTSSN